MPNLTLFPHLTSTGSPPFARDVASAYRVSFSKLVEAGTLRPLVFPYHFSSYLLLMIYLCIPHVKRPWLYEARWPILTLIMALDLKMLWGTSSASPTVAFLAGLLAAWFWVWALAWLIFYRPQWESKRVQRREAGLEKGGKANSSKKLIGENGIITSGPNGDSVVESQKQGSSSSRVKESGSPVRRRPQNFESSMEGNGRASDARKTSSTGKMSGKSVEMGVYDWQPYPKKLGDRISWVVDLVLNFRGPGWNWQIENLPSPPLYIVQQLGTPVDDSSKTGRSFTSIQRHDTHRVLLRALIPKFLLGYLIVDALKVLMMKDPYFIFGPNTYDLPPILQFLHPQVLRVLRQVETVFVIIANLETLFVTVTLILSFLLGPKVIGQRGEAWYYPSTWGSFSAILDHGLKGVWGRWWHQTFRFAFAAPTVYLLKNDYIYPRSKAAKLVALLFAFGISGLFHSAGSITVLPHTRPWDPMYFFMLQALGVVAQNTMCSVFRPWLKSLPSRLRRMGNLAIAAGWMSYTGCLLTDDLARAGIWLYEPVPFSPLRGLGFGDNGDGWWCWKDHIGVGWYTGKHWWESGIAI